MILLSTEREDLRSSLINLVEPIVEDCGGQLVDLELMGASNNQTVRVLIHKDLGVTLKDCTQISLEVANLLDVEDPIPGRYRLEVTSPGLDRPLQSDRDFDRARDRQLRVVLASGKTTRGRLKDWDGDKLDLETSNGIEQIVRSHITKATIEAEM